MLSVKGNRNGMFKLYLLMSPGGRAIIGRHPGYLGVILNYLGFVLWWGSIFPLIIALFFIIMIVFTALEEEKYLQQKFGRDYKEYMEKVRWRFVPGIF